MILFKTYRSLSLDRQAQLLWKHGVYLDLKRVSGKWNIELYALGSFYVEIYFDRKTEEPVRLHSFSDAGRLDGYIKQIELEPVLQRQHH